MEDVTRRAAVSAAAAGAVGAAAAIGSQASAQEGAMRGSQKLMAGKLPLEPRPINREALLGLVERLAQLNVVWQGWQTKGTPQFLDGVSARFAVAPGAGVEAVSLILRAEQLRPNIVIFPNGIPVIDNWGVQVELGAVE